jgi:tetratricopeptide (TPR) repeat protein
VSRQDVKSSGANFIEQVLEWARSDSLARLEMIEQLRERWREDVTHKFTGQPEKLEEIFSQGDSAFQQLSKVFRILSLPPDEKSLKILEFAEQEFKNKDYSKALKNFNEAFQLKVKMSVGQMVEAGMAAYYLDQFQEAEKWAHRARSLDSEIVQALLLTGLICYAQKDFEKAKEIFDRAQRLKPDSPTIVRYLRAVEDKLRPPPEAGTLASDKDTKTKDKKCKRRWLRKPCNLQMTVNAFDQMTALSARVRSLSAGGCLIDEMPVPEQFSFVLDLGNGKQVEGEARKIYTNSLRQVGLRFDSLSLDQQDLIHHRLML